MDNERLGELEKEVESTIKLYETFISGSAIRTRQMIERKGTIKALEDLVQSSDYQAGFRKLHQNNKLDKSFEALVKKYDDLFSKNAVTWAMFRLENPEALK